MIKAGGRVLARLISPYRPRQLSELQMPDGGGQGRESSDYDSAIGVSSFRQSTSRSNFYRSVISQRLDPELSFFPWGNFPSRTQRRIVNRDTE